LLPLIESNPCLPRVLPLDHSTIEDVLPSNLINCIFQDARGCNWEAGRQRRNKSDARFRGTKEETEKEDERRKIRIE